MHFEILGEIQWTETIASGRSIRELRRLNRIYEKTTWRKKKGIAKIRLADRTIRLAELHWYEGCIFRRIPATDSDPKRPPIPMQSGHVFRFIPAGYSDPFRPPLTEQPKRRWIIHLKAITL